MLPNSHLVLEFRKAAVKLSVGVELRWSVYTDWKKEGQTGEANHCRMAREENDAEFIPSDGVKSN